MSLVRIYSSTKWTSICQMTWLAVNILIHFILLLPYIKLLTKQQEFWSSDWQLTNSVTQLVKTWRFIPSVSLPHSQNFTTEPYPNPFKIQFTPWHHISRRSILILASYLYLDLLGSLLHWSFQPKMLYWYLISTVHAKYPASLNLLDSITLIISGEEYM